jgi:enterochelin esterase-like enzyme
MLVANDGPEYDSLASLTHFSAVMIAQGRLAPHRVALLAPGERNQWYSASAAYARVLAHDVVPQLRETFGVVGAPVAMGASLGALAMLHAHIRHPKAFDGLLLQSGSFFRQRHDKYESRFPRYRRITRFVGGVLRGADDVRPIPIAITCGTAEENRANNEDLAAALIYQGYTSWISLVRDAHTWTCWRDSFHPHLPALIEAAS